MESGLVATILVGICNDMVASLPRHGKQSLIRIKLNDHDVAIGLPRRGR